jgi:hypothetical protein
MILRRHPFSRPLGLRTAALKCCVTWEMVLPTSPHHTPAKYPGIQLLTETIRKAQQTLGLFGEWSRSASKLLTRAITKQLTTNLGG